MMQDPVYRLVELCGTSKTDIEGAIQNAISRAMESARDLKWFNVLETRGLLEKDRVVEWQVVLKVAFDVETSKQAAAAQGSKEKEPAQGKQGGTAAKFRCTVCGYIYDPEKGDPTQDIKPGTSFEDLPESWKCPECGVGKDKFEKMA